MPVLIATVDTIDDLLPGATTAIDDDDLIGEYLLLAAEACGANTDFWGTNLARAQALRAMHLMVRAGVFTRASIEDPGESAPVANRSAGANGSMGYGPGQSGGSPEDADLSLTRWGRLYLDIKRSRLARSLPSVMTTSY